jgi:hypothetical protein
MAWEKLALRLNELKRDLLITLEITLNPFALRTDAPN